MKYLKHINETSSDVENIISDINDMLYELRDEGFDCEINNIPDRWTYLTNAKNQLSSDSLFVIDNISINIDKAPHPFSFDEVSDCIHRIFDYTYEKGCIIKYNIGYEQIKYDGNFDNIKMPEYLRDAIFNIIISIEFGIIYKRYRHIKQYEKIDLKLFENGPTSRLSERDVMSYFKDQINWDMIENIKDMSLEYLDDGFNLKIFIMFRPMNHWSMNDIYSLTYSHDKNFCKSKYVSLSIPCYLYYDKDNKIIHDFWESGEIFYNCVLYKTTSNPEMEKRYTMELKNRIKDAYPNENV